jgi:predicted RNA-binding Zn ribbon-like protein
MARKVRNLSTLDRCGNAAALDFVNTVHSRVETDTHEYLQSYADLATWALDGGLVSTREYRRLTDTARSRPRLAGGVLKRAIDLRELLYRLFLASIRNNDPSPEDIEALNKHITATLGRRRVRREGGAFVWSWDSEPESLDRPLWPVVLSAVELLASTEHTRLKECPMPDGCGWLFLDTSKNRTRKWCNMRTCGNVVKARRYYRRHADRTPLSKGRRSRGA